MPCAIPTSRSSPGTATGFPTPWHERRDARAMGALLTGNLPAAASGRPLARCRAPLHAAGLALPHRLLRRGTALPATPLPHVRTRTSRSVLHELAQGRPERFERWIRSIRATTEPTFYSSTSSCPTARGAIASGQQYLTGAEPVPGWGHAFGSPWVSIQIPAPSAPARLRRPTGGLADRSFESAGSLRQGDRRHQRRQRRELRPGRRRARDLASQLRRHRAHAAVDQAPCEAHGTVPARHVRSEDVVPTLSRLTTCRFPPR